MNDIRDYFDGVAPAWDAMREQFFGEGVRRAAIAAAGIEPGMTVTDIGVRHDGRHHDCSCAGRQALRPGGIGWRS